MQFDHHGTVVERAVDVDEHILHIGRQTTAIDSVEKSACFRVVRVRHWLIVDAKRRSEQMQHKRWLQL